LIKLVKFLK